jgi:alpha-galactosidase
MLNLSLFAFATVVSGQVGIDTAATKPVIPGASSYNGLALTPQMGWDNWNAFGCNINESILLDTAQAMVDYGLKDLGYNYVVLDDCWSSGRDAGGNLVPDANKFPNVSVTHVSMASY